jgi:teichuronic acid biosynthesis glycosyltransferase TuaG
MPGSEASALRTVTVIIPAYNAERFLKRNLQSIADQTYSAWSAIVVDDGSTDRTREIVLEFAARDERFRLIALKKNHGAPAGPRNRGVAAAEGEWIAFLDADDIWHPKKLELQMTALDVHAADFSCTAMHTFRSEDELITASYSAPAPTRWLSAASHRFKGRIPASSVVVKTSLALQFPFEEKPEYKAVEDYHCWLRILDTGRKCLKIELPLLNYRHVPGQISGSKLKMIKRMYNLHLNYEKSNAFRAVFYTTTHVIGAAVIRGFGKSL